MDAQNWHLQTLAILVEITISWEIVYLLVPTGLMKRRRTLANSAQKNVPSVTDRWNLNACPVQVANF